MLLFVSTNSLEFICAELNIAINKNTISYDAPVDDEGTAYLDRFEYTSCRWKSCLEEIGVEEIMQCVESCIAEVNNKTQRSILEYWRKSKLKAVRGER